MKWLLLFTLILSDGTIIKEVQIFDTERECQISEALTTTTEYMQQIDVVGAIAQCRPAN